MTITTHWWWLVIALIILPIIYSIVRKRNSDWDLMLDVAAAFFLSWGMAVGIIIGHLL